MAEDQEHELASEVSDRPSTDQIRAISDALDRNDPAAAAALVEDFKAPDFAEVIELLEPEQRVALIQALGPAVDFEFLSELDENVRDQLSEALPNDILAQAVTQLDTDDAAYVLENLEESDQQEILAQLPSGEREAIERNLEYPEETAGRLMQSDFVAVPPFWTVGKVIDHMHDSDDLPEHFSEIFVVDPTYRVLGSVDLSRLLRSKRNLPIKDIMEPDRHVVLATEGQDEIARQFRRYDLMSAPVVDANNRLVGVVTVDDVVEVIQEEAEEDIKALAGVGDESVSDTVIDTVRSRVPWLIVNLGTAFLSAAVIERFDATIQQMVQLAVLMPIVASMGGNAGMQTMTVTVRALATNKLGPVNAPRVITREACVGVINGLVLSTILSLAVFLWFGSGKLGAIIAIAMILNAIAAALAGILIPLTLNALKLDPAPASGVFVTTVTDVTGFFAFLGLASIYLR